MKESKRITLGLLALLVLLLGYTIFTAARASRLEGRLKQVDGAYQELQARHQAFVVTVSNAMLQAQPSAEAIVRARVATSQESLVVPPPTVLELPGGGVNSMPQGVTTK